MLEYKIYLHTVNEITGLTPAQENALKIKEIFKIKNINELISKKHKEYASTEAGKLDYKNRGKKSKETKIKNNIYQKAGLNLSNWLNEIDEETGLSNAQLRSLNIDYDIKRDNLGCLSLREFLSINIGGDNNPMKNEETKNKMINSLKEWNKVNDNPFKGKKHSKESLDLMASKKIGENNPCFNKKWVNNGKINLRVYENEIPDGFVLGRLKLNRNKSQIKTCPHCQKSGRGGNMKRYHFDNCKKKKENKLDI